ncbi:MAG: NB-ARC domain-containing protein [Trueperaceae bacterium]|nr:NB-ARC domain-containing protein [Trueperaceae bacterium]
MLLRTLGGLALEGGEVARRKPLLLCAYLAVEGSKDRRHVAELFWGATNDPASNLRVALSQLRRASPDLVHDDGPRVGTRVRTDAQALLDDLERGIADRVDDYRGPFLQGLENDGLPAELEEWVLGTRAFFGARVRARLVTMAARRLERHERGDALRLAERALSLGPLEEFDPEQLPALHEVLSRLGSSEVDRVAALAREYGVPLDAEQGATTGSVEGNAVRSPPSRLPRSTSRFVGRRNEIETLVGHLVQPHVRLITLLGGAGTGKTRLASEVARRLFDAGHYPDGAFTVDLADLVDARSVPDRIAQTLDVVVLANGREAAQLAKAIGERCMLLVLDNFEQVREAADLVAYLVRHCPALDVLVTSRERLALSEAWVVRVGGLTTPMPDVAEASQIYATDAGRLFRIRAARVRGGALGDTDAGAVARICRAVAGNPLAIELAAPWLRVLSPDALADEVERGSGLLDEGDRDLPHRHRGLRAAFEHSWSLLDGRDQGALRRLSVFRGGFERTLAARVANVTLPSLTRLVDASLIAVADDGRYDRHPLLYAFTEDKLADHPGERNETRARHGREVLDLLDVLHPKIMGGESAGDALRRMRQEEANIEAAWGWALEAGEWARIEAALPCLAAYTEFQSRYHFGHALADRVVRSIPADHEPLGVVRALALGVRGFSVFRAGDPGRVERDGYAALESAERATRPHDERAVPTARWWAHHAIALAGKVRGDAASILHHSREALTVAEAALGATRDPGALAVFSVMAGINHHVLCLGAAVMGDHDTAARHDRASRAHLQRFDSHADAYGAQTTGLLRLLAGDPGGATDAVCEGLDRSRRVGYGTATANLLEVLARAEFARGDLAAAEAACDEALRITTDTGDVWLGTSMRALKGTLAAAHDDATAAHAWYARAYDMAEAHDLLGFGMEAVVGRAALAEREGHAAQAAALLRLARDHPFAPVWVREEARRRAEALGADAEPAPELTLPEVRKAMLPAP